MLPLFRLEPEIPSRFPCAAEGRSSRRNPYQGAQIASKPFERLKVALVQKAAGLR